MSIEYLCVKMIMYQIKENVRKVRRVNFEKVGKMLNVCLYCGENWGRVGKGSFYNSQIFGVYFLVRHGYGSIWISSVSKVYLLTTRGACGFSWLNLLHISIIIIFLVSMIIIITSETIIDLLVLLYHNLWVLLLPILVEYTVS